MSLISQYKAIQKNLSKLYDHQISCVRITDNLESFYFTVEPKEGLWQGGRYTFKANLKNYPNSAPQVQCITNSIKHPNISSRSSGVCLSLIEEWKVSYGLDDLLQAMLFLFYEPNFEDPLVTEFENCRATQYIIEYSLKEQILERRAEEEARVSLVQSLVSSIFSRF